MPELILGPSLRFASQTEATLWMETDSPCEVEVLGRRAATFTVEGHHFALVVLRDLEPGSSLPYEVNVDGERRWPPMASAFPASRVRTLPASGPVSLVFGSCRVAAPHELPYTNSPDNHTLGFGIDALYALAVRMREQDPEQWPDMLLMLGDQVYADEVSPETVAFIRSRRDVRQPPGDEIADFEEYTYLYREAWQDPAIRWLLSTVPTAMIFDDHDVHDDWNTSETWVERMRARPWWHERITSALATYWIYQHLGNLSPDEVEQDDLFARLQTVDDGGPALRAFAADAEREGGGGLWSYSRDLGTSRLVVLDGREGRVLSRGRREMLDEQEWTWIEQQVSGDFDHLILANTLPVLLPPTLHYLEAWNEAVCAGAWGLLAARAGEVAREAIDLEHWAAFQGSFARLVSLVRDVGSGRYGRAPATIAFLGGDVHQAYLEEVSFPEPAAVDSRVYQAVCSPFRNPLDQRERRLLTFGRRSRLVARIVRAAARAARVPDPPIGWELLAEPTFDNQLATLTVDGRRCALRLECASGTGDLPELNISLQRELA